MGHDTNQQTGCSTTSIILAIVAGMALFFVLLVVGVGALFYTRARTSQQHALMAREEAVQQAERARLLAEQARAQAEAERERAEALAGKLENEKTDAVVVVIDKDGSMMLDGESVGVENLQVRLATMKGQNVMIEADPQCPFEHVAAALAICRKAEIEGVQVRMNPGAPNRK